MRKIPILFCLLLIVCMHVQAQPVSVYPGDTDNSGKCTHHDLLYIGLHYGATGPQRTNGNLVWGAQIATQWTPSGGQQLAYVDCDGNGIIERGDALAIEQNFGLLQNSGTLLPDTNTFTTLGTAPTLQVNILQDSLLVVGQIQFTFDLILGTPFIAVDSIYGLAVTLSYDPTLVDNAAAAFNSSSFLSNDSMAISYARVDSLQGKIYLAITRIDHANRTGSGSIASIGIVMDDNIRIAAHYELVISVESAFAITSNGNPVYLQASSDTLMITGAKTPSFSDLTILPNPVHDQLVVHSKGEVLQAVRLYDSQGKLVASDQHLNTQSTIFQIGHLAPGCYFVEVQVNDGILRKKLIIQPY